MLELYQYEECPYCALVREALDARGLDYIVRTEPRSHAERRRVRELSKQTGVPVLVDPDRDCVVVESREIVAYLDRHYGRQGS